MKTPKIKIPTKKSRNEVSLEGTLTPRQIVAELDNYIIGQDEAKRSVAIALRNRTRRQMLSDEMRDEVMPKNIIMIGPTGVGKTEIARRLSSLAKAPFIKVEASKFTEVGYVGRDVESMVRDLTDIAVNMLKAEQTREVEEEAEEAAEERLLDCLIPPPKKKRKRTQMRLKLVDEESEGEEDGGEKESPDAELKEETPEKMKSYNRTRERFRKMLREGKLEDRPVEISVRAQSGPFIEVLSPSGGMEEMNMNLNDMFSSMLPKQTKKKKVTVEKAREILIQEEAEKLVDMDKVKSEAVARVENSGIIFLDELDKVAGRESKSGPDVSREGVQRDILPIVEGSSVFTKYGMVNTHHILFIAAGAFHTSSPSDLIPELQGRFPIRVELNSLTKEDFGRILTEPKNALVKQYTALLETEEVQVSFEEDAIGEIALLAYQVNEKLENIGARRLHTIMEKLFDKISFDAPELDDTEITIDAEYVQKQLADIVKDTDLSRYIL